MSTVGQNVPHDSAPGHVTGTSRYIDDLPRHEGELVVDFFYSPVAHARIAGLDLAAAAQVPGVVALFTHRDLAHNRLGPITHDEPLLAEDELTFVGQPVVVIAAETRAAIRAAKAAIRLDVDERTPVFSIDDAIARGSYLCPPRAFGRGDVAAALAAAPRMLAGVFVCGGQDHFYLESQAALALPGEGDTLVVHSSTQHPTEVQGDVAKQLGLGIHQVTCITTRMGGGFGGKESQATHPAVMAALVALKTGRPARIVYAKDDDMVATGKRHPFQNRYRVGFTEDGTITALEVDLYSNGGAYVDLSPAVMARAICHTDNAYYLPVCRITGHVCRTNLPPNTAFRGFGGPQGAATIECILEEIAATLGLDPFDVRRRNVYGEAPRNVTPYGQVVTPNTLPELFDRLAATSDYRARMAEVARVNAASKTHLRGLSMTAVKFGISFNTKFLNQASALVHVYLDGTVQVSTGATEMGQGVNTKIRQIVADVFGLAVDRVRILPTSTERSPNASATAASSGADLNGSAAENAALLIRARMAEVAAAHFAEAHGEAGAPGDGADPLQDTIAFEGGDVVHRPTGQRLAFAALALKAYHGRVSLGERGYYATEGLSFDWDQPVNTPFLYFTNGCAVSEVEIDRFTGGLRVLRADLLLDIGESINPGIDRGQITGAFVQGMGWLTAEELRYSARGELWTHSPTTYKIPAITDVPPVFNVDWIENRTHHVNLRRSKAVGEPPLLLGISVWTAAKHALSFVSRGEVARLHAPASHEELLTRIAHYTRPAPAGEDGLPSRPPVPLA